MRRVVGEIADGRTVAIAAGTGQRIDRAQPQSRAIFAIYAQNMSAIASE
jgi:hypothetical protein